MAWVPYEKYTLESKLTVSQIEKKIASKIPENIPFNISSFKALFVNERNTDSFQVSFLTDHLIIREKVDVVFGGYVNSYRPQATIKFLDNENGSTNTVVIKPDSGIIIATLVMLFFVLIGGISLLLTNKIHDGVLVMLVFPIVVYLISTISFNIELGKIQLFIDYLLETNYII